MNENIETVKSFYGALPESAGGDGVLSDAFEFLSPDIDWTIVGPSDVIPYAGHRKGHAGVGDYFAAHSKSEDVLAFEPREFFVQDDTVIGLGHYRARVKATGGEFEFDWVHVFTFDGGRISKFCEYTDTAAAVRAFQQ